MEEISTNKAPESIGPFSQGIQDGGTIYVSGQGPVSPATGNIVSDDVQEQTSQTLDNIKAILQAADTSLGNVIKTTVFVTNMADYDEINEVYARYMSEPFPARTAVEVADLPIDIAVEIEVVASA